MKINKQLKYAEFSYDEEDKIFTITEEDGNRVILNKIYAFAFMRFVVRMAQRNWLRKTSRKAHKAEEVITELEEENIDNPSQMLIFKDE
jgi:hypothetical protein